MTLLGLGRHRGRAARIGVWGTFDVDNYGDHLFPRIAAAELRRRLPGVVVRAYSPMGSLHPTRLDDRAWPVTPLGAWSEARLAALAAELDGVLVGGGELIHLNDRMLAPVYGVDGEEMERLAPSRFFVEGLGPELEATCPAVWHGLGVPIEPTAAQAGRLRAALADRPYVSVRDEGSRSRLVAAGVVDPEVIAVVPDSALLLPRLFPPSMLRRRLDRLGAVGGFPRSGPTIVIQGCDLLVPYADDIVAGLAPWLARHPDHQPVLLETGRGRGDGDFADAIGPQLGPRRPYRVPVSARVEDIAAVLAGGSAFVGSSLHGAITAFAYDRPFAIVNVAPEPKLEAFAFGVGAAGRVARTADEIGAALDGPPPSVPLAALQRRIDEHFDRVVAIITSRAAAPPGRSTPRARLRESGTSPWPGRGRRSS